MSKIRELKPWPVMSKQRKKLTPAQIKANEDYQVAMADTTNLTRVMAKLAQMPYSAVFLDSCELESMVGLPDIDYGIVCDQIQQRKLTSCGQGGYYHIERQILDQWKSD